jgi:hypothetical protein
VQTDVLIKEGCILKNKNKLCPYKKLSVFYDTCLKTFGSHLVLKLLSFSQIQYTEIEKETAAIFLQGGAPRHFTLTVRHALIASFLFHVLGRCEPINWPLGISHLNTTGYLRIKNK